MWFNNSNSKMEIYSNSVFRYSLYALLLISVLAFAWGYYKGSRKKEPFTQADVSYSTNTGIGDSQPEQVNQPETGYYPNTGLQPIIIANSQEFLIIKCGCLDSKTVSSWITTQFRHRVYPCTPAFYSATRDIYDAIVNGQIDIGFIREYYLLDKAIAANTSASVSVLCPAYEEMIFMLASDLNTINNIRDIITNQRLGIKTSVGVLINSVYEFTVILKANKLPADLSLSDLPFNISYYNSTTDMFLAIKNKQVDAVFWVGHPYETPMMDFVRTHPVRLVELYPPSKYPVDGSVYNPDTEDLIEECHKTVKRYLNWAFDCVLPVNKQVKLKEPGANADIYILTPGTSIYKTFKIRSLLCINSQNTDTRILNVLAKNLLYQAFNINQLLNEWNTEYIETNLALQMNPNTQPTANNNQSKNNTPSAKPFVNSRLARSLSSKNPGDYTQGNKQSGQLFMYYDYDSMNPLNMSVVPKELEIQPVMRDLLASKTNKIKIEYVSGCPV